MTVAIGAAFLCRMNRMKLNFSFLLVRKEKKRKEIFTSNEPGIFWLSTNEKEREKEKRPFDILEKSRIPTVSEWCWRRLPFSLIRHDRLIWKLVKMSTVLLLCDLLPRVTDSHTREISKLEFFLLVPSRQLPTHGWIIHTHTHTIQTVEINWTRVVTTHTQTKRRRHEKKPKNYRDLIFLRSLSLSQPKIFPKNIEEESK